MRLELLDGELAICRLEPGGEVPGWASGAFVAIVRSDEELSVVCDAAGVPEDVQADGKWRALRVAGALDLALTGVLIRILEPLEESEIPIFAVSSFDTDYVLVPGGRLDEALAALAAAGFDL